MHKTPNWQSLFDKFGKTPETFTLADARQFHQYANKFTQTRESARELAEELIENHSMEELGWTSLEDGIDYLIETAKESPSVVSLALEIPADREAYRASLLDKMRKVDISCEEPTTMVTRSQTKRKIARTRRRGGNRSRRTGPHEKPAAFL
jgi:hypothetical protein